MEMQTFKHSVLNWAVTCVNVEGSVWFKGKDIATILGYSNTRAAIRNSVEVEDKKELDELGGQSDCPLGGTQTAPLTSNESSTIYINESGLFSLIISSQKQESKQFKHWLTSEVLPSIRKYGTYTVPLVTSQIRILNEKDLHFKVIAFIRKYLPDAIIVPGLGENQTTQHLRYESKMKGYTSGTPDILLLNHHNHYNGLAIELKTPNGKGILSDNQATFLSNLDKSNFKTVVTNDYDEVIIILLEYFKGIHYKCKFCMNNRTQYKSIASLEHHINSVHK